MEEVFVVMLKLMLLVIILKDHFSLDTHSKIHSASLDESLVEGGS